MQTTIEGSFTIDLAPQPADGEPTISRLLLDKSFEGPLSGRSRGQMLATQGDVEGSAAYVAIERFQGELTGRSGGFALAHVGLQQGRERSLRVVVVPDSGTDELVGLTGEMAILVDEAGSHTYRFTYALQPS